MVGMDEARRRRRNREKMALIFCGGGLHQKNHQRAHAPFKQRGHVTVDNDSAEIIQQWRRAAAARRRFALKRHRGERPRSLAPCGLLVCPRLLYRAFAVRDNW
jgi:hypothetical protein